MKYLLLWDIDGTLIDSGGAGRRALVGALEQEFGVSDPLTDVEFAGRTDYWIARAVFRKLGLAANETTFARFFAAYLERLPGELDNPHARVLPGARELVHAARQHGAVAQGLLTGNLRRGAEIKLAYHKLWDAFPFGAFGDDGEQRLDLGPHAVRRALAHHGIPFVGDAVWIIGDTPHDIACGRALGARTLAVATGGTNLAELQACEPTAAVTDLRDTAALLRLLTS